MPNVRIFDVPDTVRRKLLRYAPEQCPTWTPQDKLNHRPLTSQERMHECWTPNHGIWWYLMKPTIHGGDRQIPENWDSQTHSGFWMICSS